MSTIFTIIKSTVKESIRDRFFYSVSLLGILFILTIFFLSSISLDQGKKVVTDFGLAGILFFGIILAILLGANLLHKELIGGMALLIFPKPISKRNFLIGKFLGISFTLLIVTLVLTLVFSGGFYWQYRAWPSGSVYLALLAGQLETFLLVSLSILFGTFSTPVISSLYALAFFIVGHSFTLILAAAKSSGAPIFLWLAKGVFYFLPNLEKFNLRSEATYNLTVSGQEIINMFLYALIYIVLLLFLANLAIKKREF